MKTFKEWLKTKIDNSQFEIVGMGGISEGIGILKVKRNIDGVNFGLYDSFFSSSDNNIKSIDSIVGFSSDLIHVRMLNSKTYVNRFVEINDLDKEKNVRHRIFEHRNKLKNINKNEDNQGMAQDQDR